MARQHRDDGKDGISAHLLIDHPMHRIGYGGPCRIQTCESPTLSAALASQSRDANRRLSNSLPRSGGADGMAVCGPVADWPVADGDRSKLPNRKIGRARHSRSAKLCRHVGHRMMHPPLANHLVGQLGRITDPLPIGDVRNTRPPAISKRDLSGNVDPTKLVAIGITNVGQVDRSHSCLARTG